MPSPKFREPTPEECKANAMLLADDRTVGYAIWYPQMGGYVGRAVVFHEGGCVGVRVWHNGEFPFTADTDSDEPEVPPAHLHHCTPEGFIDFGETVMRLLGTGK